MKRVSLLSLRPNRGFSLLEVLVSLAVLLTGIVALLSFLPQVLRTNQRSADISIAAYLAQMKAEEIRRDDNSNGDFISTIRSLNTPTSPLAFATDSRFAYQFSGMSMIDPTDSPDDPRDDAGVARVIVRYAASYRPSGEILYELRFGN